MRVFRRDEENPDYRSQNPEQKRNVFFIIFEPRISDV
jgi:hypothetical protein